jgi:hypothetical protein
VLAVEGFEHPEFDADDAPRRRGGRSGAPSAGGRGDRPRRGAPRHETAAPAAVEAVVQVPVDHDVVAERPARRERKPAKHEPRAERSGPAPIQMGGPTSANSATVTPISSARGHHRRRDEEDDERVVGFGDHLPAFLARPVKTSARGA